MSLFDVVPDEVLVQILSFVEKEELHICKCVCRRWNSMGNDRALFERRQTINVSFLGATGVGKTSLIGQLLVQNKDVSDRSVYKAHALAKELKRESQRLALLVDSHKEEHRRGFTIDTRRKRLNTHATVIDLISVPGNVQYFKNLACGITQADDAVLVIDADEGAFASQVHSLRQILYMLKIQSVRSIILAVNKMDRVAYEKEAYDVAVERTREMFDEVKLKWDKVIAVPCATMENSNVHGTAGREMRSWYHGPTVFGALAALKCPLRAFHKPLRITIDKTYSIKGIGTVVCGTVLQGIVRVEQPIKVAPRGLVTEVKSIHLALTQEGVSVAYPGEYIGMALRGINREDCGRRKIGMITGHLPNLDEVMITTGAEKRSRSQYSRNTVNMYSRADLRRILRAAALYNADGFVATISIWNPRGRIRSGFECVMHVHNAQFPAKIVEVLEIVKRSARRENAPTDDLVYRREVVVARFSVNQASLETEEANPRLARFILRNDRTVIGGGIIREIFFDRVGRQQLDDRRKK